MLYKYNTNNYQEREYHVFNQYDKLTKCNCVTLATCFTEDNHKRIWIGTEYSGLFYYDEQKDTIQHIALDKSISSFQDGTIHTIYSDQEKNILIGTADGIYVFNPSQQFNIVPQPDVTSVFQTSTGSILVGTTKKGWFIYDKNFQLKNSSTIRALISPIKCNQEKT